MIDEPLWVRVDCQASQPRTLRTQRTGQRLHGRVVSAERKVD